MKLDARIPEGPISDKWTEYKGHVPLVSPANKRRIDVIVVGTGLAGSSAAASLAELGYNVKAFCFQDSPRRAHSIAAQGGINAAKNYQNDGDSVFRLFYDTVKGGDYRSREANVHRLAEVSASIIDQCVAQGVPFARDYGGQLDNRSFGGVQVSRTFYAKGQTGQQLLLGAYSALSRQIANGRVKMYHRHEMVDVVTVDGKARGIIAKNLVTGKLERHSAAQKRSLLRQPVLYPNPPHLHPRQRRTPVQTDVDVGILAERRAHLGPPPQRRRPSHPRRPFEAHRPPRRKARLLLGAPLPRLRKPGSA
jgi:succinate dehydrogenase / fumarate reductase flavoprotein subunit